MRAGSLRRSLCWRLLWLIPSVLVVLLTTFALMEAIPGDRAVVTAADRQAGTAPRRASVEQLRARYGLVDPVTGATRPWLHRFSAWVGRAGTLNFVEPERRDAFRRRIWSGVVVTAVVGLSALSVAFALGILCGAAWGGGESSVFGAVSVVLPALPGVLLTTLGMLAAPWLGLPRGGFGCAVDQPSWACALTIASQLALPVAVLAAAPTVVVARHVRVSLRSAMLSLPADALRGAGFSEKAVRARMLRSAMVPAASLVASFGPMVLGGSVVVENVFGLPGLASLGFDAILDRDDGGVLAVTLLGTLGAVVSSMLSDLLQLAIDPRLR